MNIGNPVSSQAAASAYANSMNMAKVSTTTPSSQDQGVSFADMMKDNIVKSIDTLKTGEQMSAKAVTGQADLTEVVQAVNSAELTLQTIVALRDRMISAYQDIMRMPI